MLRAADPPSQNSFRTPLRLLGISAGNDLRPCAIGGFELLPVAVVGEAARQDVHTDHPAAGRDDVDQALQRLPGRFRFVD